MEFITVGQIVNTHGIKGELKVYPLTDDMKRFRKLEKVYIDGLAKNVVWCKLQPTTVILKLENLDTFEEAILLKDKYLTVDKNSAVKLAKDRYFITDIIGCMVYDTENKSIGKVADIIFTGSNDVYWIKDPELLIPALKKIVVEMDITNKKIIIQPVASWQ